MICSKKSLLSLILLFIFIYPNLSHAEYSKKIGDITISGHGIISPINIDFYFNNEKKSVANNDLILNSSEGINFIKYTNQPNKLSGLLITILSSGGTTGDLLESSKENIFYYYHKNGDQRKVVLDGRGIFVVKKDSLGNYTPEISLKFKNTTHTLHLKPDNASVFLKEVHGKWEKMIFSNTSPQSINIESMKSILISFTMLDLTSQTVNFVVKWEKFHEEKSYTINIQSGTHSESHAYIENDNSNYLNYQISMQPEENKINFICQHSIHKGYNTYDECIDFYKKEAEQLAILENEKIKKIDHERKLTSNEGFICTAKLKSKFTVEEFNKCFDVEEKKSESQRRFNDALQTEEGIDCSKKYKNNDENFWACHKEKFSILNAKKKLKEDIEKEELAKKLELANLLKRDDIARQCVEIGFEINTNSYRECYLKLKLHTEQIAEWRKIQAAMQNQFNNNSNYQTNSNSTGISNSQAEALLGIAQSGLDYATGKNASGFRAIPAPPAPMQIITPRGNSYNCSMMGAALRCR